MKLHENQTSQDGVLVIGGVRADALKAKYGTPLYIMDEGAIRAKAKLFKTAFVHPELASEVIYASKAFLTKAMARLIAQEGLSLDVVSGGELYTALAGGFPPERIYFHGNNKSSQELREALNAGVGTVIIDNETELNLLENLLSTQGSVSKRQKVMLRVNPGIEAHTHDYISTTKNDSKFGLSIFEEATGNLIRTMATHPRLDFQGLHCHIGSQVFEESSYQKEARAMLEYVQGFAQEGIRMPALNLGGGFGVAYMERDEPLDLETFLTNFLEFIDQEAKTLKLLPLRILIEPGRSLVANAGVTLYEVGATKTTTSGRAYVFVDGSMADHIRTALYGAAYEAVLANRLDEAADHIYTVTGKACESGDIIVRDAYLPLPKRGDLLAVLSTGAYHYSMASNYNRLAKPAVVFVRDGLARVVVQRETYEDLIRNDREEGYESCVE